MARRQCDDTLSRVGPCENVFQDAARFTAIIVHVYVSRLEARDGLVIKGLHLLVQIKEGNFKGPRRSAPIVLLPTQATPLSKTLVTSILMVLGT